jgi:hypothetical protein
VVSPQGKDGAADPAGKFVRQGARTIYRENGKRLIAVRFRASRAAAAQARQAVPSSCQVEWDSR